MSVEFKLIVLRERIASFAFLIWDDIIRKIDVDHLDKCVFLDRNFQSRRDEMMLKRGRVTVSLRTASFRVVYGVAVVRFCMAESEFARGFGTARDFGHFWVWQKWVNSVVDCTNSD